MLEQRICWVLLSVCICLSAYSLCAPFLPIELESKGLPGTCIGIIFAFYAVGSIAISPVIGKFVDKIGAENLLGLSMGIMGITFICFGLIELVEDKTSVLALAILLRLI